MISKKLAIASATAFMLAGMSAAHAQSTPTGAGDETAEPGLVSELAVALGAIVNSSRLTAITQDSTGVIDADFTSTGLIDITAIAGAVNLSTINGSIDISGTNVSIKGIEGDVSAKAEAIGETTSNATSFAINGSNFSTTVIGAMNSSTLDVMGKTTDLASMVGAKLGVTSLAGDGTAAIDLPAITPPSEDALNQLAGFEAAAIFDTGTTATSFDLGGLTSELNATGSAMVEELQTMSVFNMALNVAPIVAGVQIAASVDTDAWFLNPQTGIVDLSNIQIATTAIGAMNSSITRLGANLAK